MSLAVVPIELLQEILGLALCDHRCPAELLCVNKTFFKLGQSMLHAHLDFHSISQLILFSEGTGRLSCAPKTLSVSLAGSSADFEIFKHMAAALRRCLCSTEPSQEDMDKDDFGDNSSCTDGTKLPLERLSLRLHSHSGNPHLSYLYEALALVK